jgi:putative ABC transport system permease protein
MGTLLQDIRYSIRTLAKSPAFTAIAVGTLALGIGANTALFSAVDAVLLKPLRFKDPASIALVWEKLPKHDVARNTVSPPNFLDWQQQNSVFSGMAAFLDQPLNLTGSGEPEQVDVELVSPNFFSLLGVNPMIGRGFSVEDSGNSLPSGPQQANGNSVVLSYGLWKSKFAADPDIVGKTVELNGASNTVIGVMGPDFDWYVSEFSITHQRPQLWAVLATPPDWHDHSKVGRFLRVVARLKPGVSLAQAQSQMDVIAAGLEERYPEFNKDWGVTLVPLRDQLSGALRPALLVLLGAVGLVLLIACVNISSLLLSRAAGRSREIAIRVALGASRGRIVRQFLTESLLLAVVGGALGVFLAIWATEVLIQAGSGSLADLTGVGVNWRVLAFVASVTLLAGLLAGFLPSFMASRAEVASALPEGGRTSSAGRKSLAARSAFVVAEISLALILLAGSSLLIQSFFRLTEVNPGFHTEHLLTFQIALPDSKYVQEQQRAAFFTQLLGKIRALPDALAASADVTPPFSGLGAATDFAIVGEAPLPAGEAHGTAVRVIEPDYFRTMGIPLLRGRVFQTREFADASHVVIVNQTLAEEYFPGQNPLGQKIIIDMKDQNLPDEIIGVVGDVRETNLSSAPYPLAYWPYPELPYSVMTVLVRTATPPLLLVPAIRDALHQMDKNQPMAKISTMDQLVANSVARSRFTMLLLSAFAGLAVVLACIGIYGVMAYAVTQRTHEIGIRLALGAQRDDVLRLVLQGGARLALLGVGIGIAGALLLTRLLSALLYGITASDPLTFVGDAVLLTFVALIACYVPARRAMRVDPIVALRYE